MTPVQFERWQDFALRMARTYPRRGKAFRSELAEYVDDFIHSVTQGGDATHLITDWDSQIGEGDYFCDAVMDYIEGTLEPGTEAPEEYVGDSDSPCRAYRKWEARWSGPFRCCIRAGLDLASVPSAGVIGFTVSDLRRMYPEGIPAWVSERYTTPEGAPIDFNAEPSTAGVWL